MLLLDGCNIISIHTVMCQKGKRKTAFRYQNTFCKSYFFTRTEHTLVHTEQKVCFKHYYAFLKYKVNVVNRKYRISLLWSEKKV